MTKPSPEDIKRGAQGIKDAQSVMPWTSIWSPEYKSDTRSYRDLQHCLINVVACAGRVLQAIERCDHYGVNGEQGFTNRQTIVKRELAYLIMSALKAANKEEVDLSEEVLRDLMRRNEYYN